MVYVSTTKMTLILFSNLDAGDRQCTSQGFRSIIDAGVPGSFGGLTRAFAGGVDCQWTFSTQGRVSPMC